MMVQNIGHTRKDLDIFQEGEVLERNEDCPIGNWEKRYSYYEAANNCTELHPCTRALRSAILAMMDLFN